MSEENLAKPVAELGKEMPGASDRILTKPTDVSKPEDVKAWIDATVEKWGPLDQRTRTWPIEKLPLSDLQEMLNINVIEAFNCLKEEMKNMKGCDSIVSCGSQQVRHASGPMSAYAASKNAIRGLSKAAAYEGGPKGIRVNLLCPTMTEDDHLTSIIKRNAKPEEIAASIAFLLSNESKFVTTQEWMSTSHHVNRQLHRETKDALERIPGRGLSYSLDLMLAKEELLWPTWTLVPAYAQHVDSVDVTVRVVDARRALPAVHKWNQWHSIFGGGDGGPPMAVWLFYSVLERFLKAGPVGKTLDPKLGEYRRSGRWYSEEEVTKLGFVDRKITVKHLNIDCVSPADEAVLADPGSSRDWWYTRRLSGLVHASHTESMDIQKHLRGVMRPEWLATYLIGKLEYLLSMGYHTAEFGAILFERIGDITIKVDGLILEKFRLGERLSALTFEESFGSICPAGMRETYFNKWKKRASHVREEAGLP
ncbi:hypothetical protein DL768_002005 [Monosporascus sp. mg162]|nr:hypothetical protein DL768_002005 [Monosporascus sp. mg162]